MRNDDRYYLYKFFEAKQDEFDSILLEDAGINPSEANIKFNRAQLMITIETTRSNYFKVADKLKDLLFKDLALKVVDVNKKDGNYVPCLYDRRFKMDFRKKYEEKYNVLLLEIVGISIN